MTPRHATPQEALAYVERLEREAHEAEARGEALVARVLRRDAEERRQVVRQWAGRTLERLEVVGG
jgi:hypothetical protein